MKQLPLPSWLKKLKMRNQFLILLSVIVTFITVFLIMLIYVTILLAQEQFLSASGTMYLKESEKQIFSNSQNFKHQLIRLLDANETQMKQLTQMYLKIKQQIENLKEYTIYEQMNFNYSGTGTIPEILRDPRGWGDLDATYSMQCYSNLTIFEDPLTPVQKLGVKIQEYYVDIGQIIYQGDVASQGQYYGYFEADQIISDYPCTNLAQTIFNYKPEKRSWYKKAIEIYNESDKNDFISGVTKPYLQYTLKKIGIALVMPVIGENQEYLGAWGTNILFNQDQAYFKISDEKVETMLLIDYEGAMLMHPYSVDFAQNPVYFSNESITGFNDQDWSEIQSNDPQSNCNGILKNSQVLCRTNSKYNKDLLIGITKITKYKMYLLMVMDNREFLQFQQQFSLKIKQFFNNSIQDYLIYLGSFVILLLIFTFASIYIFSKPIELIIKSCVERIYNVNRDPIEILKQQFKYIRLNVLSISNKIMSTQINGLYDSCINFFDQLTKLSTNKTLYCKSIENIQYPHQFYYKIVKKTLQKIKLFKHNDFKMKQSVPEDQLKEMVRKCFINSL